jgi:hypothetical protein
LSVFERKIFFIISVKELREVLDIVLPLQIPMKLVSFFVNGVKAFAAEKGSIFN